MRSETLALEHAPVVVSPDPPVTRPFSGAEFDRLVAKGFFGPDERLELVNGRILVMSPIGNEHAAVLELLDRALRRVLAGGNFVRLQNPFVVGEHRLYPDLLIVRGEIEDFMHRPPTPKDVPLVVEVADSTQAYDRGEKSEVYARGGVREYWIVDLAAKTVEVRRDPLRRRGVYGVSETLARGVVRAPQTKRGIRIASFLGFLD